MNITATEIKFITHRKEQHCNYCGSVVVGRSDKKYCDNYCRGVYNNQLKGAANNFVRNINHALGKNRRILERLLGDNKSVKVTVDTLKENGYNFKYSTHQHITPNGKTYIYCYEYGYLLLEKDFCLIVHQKD